jgi:hypothetical protein
MVPSACIGQATWRQNPATVAGAFLSGLRAAATIEAVGKTVSRAVLPPTQAEEDEDAMNAATTTLLSESDRLAKMDKLKAISWRGMYDDTYAATRLAERLEFERLQNERREALKQQQHEQSQRLNAMVSSLLSGSMTAAAPVATVVQRARAVRGLSAVLIANSMRYQQSVGTTPAAAKPSDGAVVGGDAAAAPTGLSFAAFAAAAATAAAAAGSHSRRDRHSSKKNRSRTCANDRNVVYM